MLELLYLNPFDNPIHGNSLFLYTMKKSEPEVCVTSAMKWARIA